MLLLAPPLFALNRAVPFSFRDPNQPGVTMVAVAALTAIQCAMAFVVCWVIMRVALCVEAARVVRKQEDRNGDIEKEEK